jgi:hypothetical protein
LIDCVHLNQLHSSHRFLAPGGGTAKRFGAGGSLYRVLEYSDSSAEVGFNARLDYYLQLQGSKADV